MESWKEGAPQEKDSKYKGVFRNLLLASITANLSRKGH